jgi:4-amino-4-deoxychorismate lyase
MSYTKAIYNGQLIELSDFRINQDNRAFRYGDGFFETIVTSKGKSSLLDYHVKRINKALFAFNLNSKEIWSPSVLQSHINDLLSYHEYKNARIRINFWREAKGLYAPLGNDCHYLITVKPQLGKPKTHLTKVGIYKEIPLIHHRLSAFKTLNSLPYVMAGMHKEKEAWEEVILFYSRPYK